MKRELEFASHPANLGHVRDFVRLFLKPLAFTDMEKELIVLGLDEACTNVIRYAYHQKCDQLMHLVCEDHEDQVVFRLRDYGVQCDPAKLRGRPLDLIQPGGLGIHLIRRAFSRVDYHLQKQGTELVLCKHYRAPVAEPR
jgi:anti-sigma regulatory factor (Ser/Thr protein kinase)